MARGYRPNPPPAPPNVDNVAGSPYAPRSALPRATQKEVREYVENLGEWIRIERGRAQKGSRRRDPTRDFWRKAAGLIQGAAIGGFAGLGLAAMFGKGTWTTAISQGLTGAALVGLADAVEDPAISSLLLAGGLSVSAAAIGATVQAVSHTLAGVREAAGTFAQGAAVGAQAAFPTLEGIRKMVTLEPPAILQQGPVMMYWP